MPPKLEPFADRVVAKQLLHPNAFRSAELPGIVLGPPRGAGLAYGSADVVSLGAAVNDDNGASAPYGGAITLEFVDNAIWNGPGDDFTIFENVFYIYDANGRPDPTTRFMEPAVVSVSQDGVTWHQFPTDFSPRYDPVSGKLNLHHPYCYRTGFAGVNPVMSNGLDPDRQTQLSPAAILSTSGRLIGLDSLRAYSIHWQPLADGLRRRLDLSH